MLLKRCLHDTARLAARTRYTKPKPKPAPREHVNLPTQRTHHRNDLKITAPIPPAVVNIQCSDDHPLWQFFAEKKFMRAPEDLDDKSRPWAIAELRRKSFEDLHSLWYACLKERNILARENHLLKNAVGGQQDYYENVAEKIRTTMWRIRHVLSERDWSFKSAQQDFESQKATFVQEFSADFLALPSEEDEEAFQMLSRFQQAVYGINEFIDENVVNRNFVDGLKHVATLKIQRFATRDTLVDNFLEETKERKITDAGEAFVVFTAENTLEDVKEACNAVNDLRLNGNGVSRYDELESVSKYIEQLAQAQLEKST